MIGFYFHRWFSINIGFLETFHINNQIIPHFVNLWSKELPVNISYPIIFNQIDGYLDARIIHSYVIYIITRDNQNQYKNQTTNIIQGRDIHRLF